MSNDIPTITLSIPDSEIDKSGIDAKTYVFGVAKRRAVEKSSSVAMVEYRFDDRAKMHRAIVYLKGKN